MPAREKDLHIPSQDLLTTRRTLTRLLEHPEMLPQYLGDVSPILESQLDLAKEREKYENLLSQRGRERRALIRKAFKDTAVVALFCSPVIVGAGGIAWLNSIINSPESKARRQAEEALKAEQERQRILSFETNNTLSHIPSATSFTGWRIRYPVPDPNYTFVDSTTQSIKLEKQRAYDNYTEIFFPPFPILGSGKKANMILEDYRRTDGIIVPKLTVILSEGTDYNKTSESWLLRDKPTDGIDNRAIIFENMKDQTNWYISIQRARTNDALAFDVKMMERKPVSR